MPSGKYYNKRAGRWLSKETRQAYDYDGVDLESSALLISFFRWYPDYLLDIIESENSDYSLELPQRLILRAFARYKQTFITGARGLTKTYCVMLSGTLDGIMFPGEIIRYYAPSNKQGAELAATAFHQIEKNYPALASCYMIKSETKDLFKIVSRYGSEFAIGAIQGGNCSQLICEEIGQETEPKFDFSDFESKVLPTCRLHRQVNKTYDKYHINNKRKFITNASSRTNPTYYKYHNGIMQQMIHGEENEAICLDISWEIALICNIRTIEYMDMLKRTMTAEDYLRQMCATYTGTSESPLVSDEVLSKSSCLNVMEDTHCGNLNAIYIVSHDVSSEQRANNAQCSDVVVKLTRFKSVQKRDKFLKQVVYADSYPPPANDYLQAQKLKRLWSKYCLDGGNPTYLVIDARAYGKGVVEELMKPSNDGMRPLCCYRHKEYADLEQEGAIPIIYPIKAGRKGVADEDAEMVRYAQVEFEQGNIQLLTAATLDGVEQYKRKHGIKDASSDARIAYPYRKTDELRNQIKNLQLVASGASLKETRKSKIIQRDIWSALKYALRMTCILEQELLRVEYKKKSSWSDTIAEFQRGGKTSLSVVGTQQTSPLGNRAELLANRRVHR